MFPHPPWNTWQSEGLSSLGTEQKSQPSVARAKRCISEHTLKAIRKEIITEGGLCFPLLSCSKAAELKNHDMDARLETG